jgi:hypothetical protein
VQVRARPAPQLGPATDPARFRHDDRFLFGHRWQVFKGGIDLGTRSVVPFHHLPSSILGIGCR